MALRRARGGNVRGFDHLDDVVQVAMRFGFLDGDTILGGGDPGPFDLFEGDGGAGLERGDGGDDGRLVRAGIRQRAHQHVAADSGKGIQVAEKGHDSFIVTGAANIVSFRPGAAR